MTQGTIPSNVTKAACAFIESASFDRLPSEAVRIARRCILDGLGLYVAGSDEESVDVLIKDARETGGRPDALMLGEGDFKVLE
jgi:2-methylcitrate dehydratase PrpD